ncbi:MAG: hypothetical protein ACRD29_15615 [Acidimicrobiales bacterium]
MTDDVPTAPEPEEPRDAIPAEPKDAVPARAGRVPSPVNAASIILIVLAALGLLFALLGFGAAGNEEFLADNDTTAGAVRTQSAISLFFAVVLLFLGFRIRKGSNGARIAAVAISAIGVVFGVLSLPTGILQVVLYGLVIYLLLGPPDSKEFFGGPPRAPGTVQA